MAHINPLKEGEKIKISMGHSKKPAHSSEGDSKPKTGGGGFLLKPPPAPGSTVFLHLPSGPSTNANPVMSFNVDSRDKGSQEEMGGPVEDDPFGSFNNAAQSTEDEDWGDFSSS